MSEDELRKMRKQLLEAMSAVSEDRHCAGWDYGINRELFEEGGIWTLLARRVGWPIGYVTSTDDSDWMAYDDAVANYG